MSNVCPSITIPRKFPIQNYWICSGTIMSTGWRRVWSDNTCRSFYTTVQRRRWPPTIVLKPNAWIVHRKLFERKLLRLVNSFPPRSKYLTLTTKMMYELTSDVFRNQPLIRIQYLRIFTFDCNATQMIVTFFEAFDMCIQCQPSRDSWMHFLMLSRPHSCYQKYCALCRGSALKIFHSEVLIARKASMIWELVLYLDSDIGLLSCSYSFWFSR